MFIPLHLVDKNFLMYRDMAKENDKLHDEFASTFSTLDANFVTRTNELHAAVNGNHTKTLVPFLFKGKMS